MTRIAEMRVMRRRDETLRDEVMAVRAAMIDRGVGRWWIIVVHTNIFDLTQS